MIRQTRRPFVCESRHRNNRSADAVWNDAGVDGLRIDAASLAGFDRLAAVFQIAGVVNPESLLIPDLLIDSSEVEKHALQGPLSEAAVASRLASCRIRSASGASSGAVDSAIVDMIRTRVPTSSSPIQPKASSHCSTDF